MISDANPDAFLALLSQGLITDSQHDAVLAHPETPTLPPLPSPGHALAWMRVKGLVTEEEQNAALDRIEAATPPDPNADDAADTAIDADDLMECAERGITHEAVQALYRDGLIDAETRDMALQETPVAGTVPAALGATLAWLVTDGPLERERFDATRAQVAAEPAFAMAAERSRIVAEAQALIEAEDRTIAEWKSRSQRQGRIGAWKFILTVLVIGGGLGWYLFAPDSVPACDASSTRKTLNNMMFRVTMDVRMRTFDAEKRADIHTPSLGGIREVGYRKDQRVRGCIATLTQGDDKDTMAFTIGATSPKSDEMVVRGADADIVEARFGHLDASGKPLFNAEPIGRDAMEKAFREGAESLSARSQSSALARMRAQERAASGLPDLDPDRTREIADIELTGSCRALDGGAGQQACPLVVEYNDRLLGALAGNGGTSLPLTGEFTFVQDNGTWRVGDDFTQTFMRKVVEARMRKIGATDIAMPAFPAPPKPPR
ncbi:hypothetical protein [Variovorax gossypii]